MFFEQPLFCETFIQKRCNILPDIQASQKIDFEPSHSHTIFTTPTTSYTAKLGFLDHLKKVPGLLSFHHRLNTQSKQSLLFLNILWVPVDCARAFTFCHLMYQIKPTLGAFVCFKICFTKACQNLKVEIQVVQIFSKIQLNLSL